MASGLTCEAVYTTDDPLNDDGTAGAAASSSDHSFQQDIADLRHSCQPDLWQPVTADVLRKISYGQNVRGVVAEFIEPDRSVSRLKLPPNARVLVLDSIEKPGNVGAVFRSADAAGIDAILVTGDHRDLGNPNTIRASLGAVFTVASAVGSRDQVRSLLRQGGFNVVAARVDAATSLWNVPIDGPFAAVLGNEARGLGNHWSGDDSLPVRGIRIPMAGQIDSLNLSVSAAVIAFEIARRSACHHDSADPQNR